MQTGRKIMNLRRDRSISQQDLARFCDITPSALSKIESGQNSPRGGVIFLIAKNLGVTIEYLLDEEIAYPYKGLSYREEDQAAPDSVAPLAQMEV
ncbi:MAG: helix-turn-helix domain-containing protein, partial [Planctomycetes bacterium]|nr:helix-turn-helix domain-containing protein [Planctomycetota bacterium]